ncbi:MAG: tyrosine recombinase [Spirochaetia bacterium]|nr:tyrosine recombinase [Spirochaetia bacterium]
MIKDKLLLKNYENYLLVELRLSSSTVHAYCNELSALVHFLDKSPPEKEKDSADLATLKSDDLINFIVQRKASGNLKRASISKVITALRSFYGFLIDEGVRTDNPAARIESPGKEFRIPDILDSEDIEALFKVIPTDNALGIRDRALFELVYSCGLRISEACSVRFSKLFLDEKILRITGKGNKERIVPLGNAAVYWIKTYKDSIRNQMNVNSEYLFINKRGKSLTRQAVWKRFHLYTEKIGISSKVHNLRHAYASHMLQGGADLRVVQELLGHSDIQTTQIYTHIHTGELQGKHHLYHPENKIGRK